MDTNRVEEIKDNLKLKDTSELLEIWKNNDRETYIEEAFHAVKLLLEERSVSLPEQGKEKAEIKMDEANNKEIRQSRKRKLWLLLAGVGLLIIPGFIVRTIIKTSLPYDRLGPYTSASEVPLIVSLLHGLQAVLFVVGIYLIIRYVKSK